MRRVLDPRFEGVAAQIDSRQSELLARIDGVLSELARWNHEAVAARTDAREEMLGMSKLIRAEGVAATEATTLVGRSLFDLVGEAERTEVTLAALTEESSRVRTELDRLSTEVARFAADGGPSAGAAAHMVEIAYAQRALARVPERSAVLSVGPAASTFALSVASLGYRVTVVDPRGCSFEHPDLAVVAERVEDWRTSLRFDAILCVSAIGHADLGPDGRRPQPGADRLLLERVTELAAPGATLVLTAHVGEPGPTGLGGADAAESVRDLIQGWRVVDLAFAVRESEMVWRTTADEPSGGAVPYIALVTAAAPGG